MHQDMPYEEALADAKDIQQLQDRVEVIITTTMIAVYSMPHVPEVLVKELEFREPFTTLFDKDHLGRYPFVDGQFASELLDKVLLHIAMHQLNDKASLQKAVLSVKDASNFWFLNLYKPLENSSPSGAGHLQQFPPAPLPPDHGNHYGGKCGKGRRDAPYKGGKGSKGKQCKNGKGNTTRTGMSTPEWQKKPDD